MSETAMAGLNETLEAAPHWPKRACLRRDWLDSGIYTGRTIPQIAINWLLERPTVSSVIIGARNEEQLRQNLGAIGWTLTSDQVERLDAASAVTAPYPYFPYHRQEGFARLNPPAV